MKRKVICGVLVILILISSVPLIAFGNKVNITTASEKKLNIEWRPTFELIFTVNSLVSNNNRFNTGKTNPIKEANQKYFAKYKNHSAVKLMRSFSSDGWNQNPQALALTLSSPPNVKRIVDYKNSNYLYNTKNDYYRYDSLVKELNKFYKDTNFQAYLDVNKKQYDAMVNQMKDKIKDEKSYLEVIENYFGESKNSYTIIVSPLMQGGMANIIYDKDKENLYSTSEWNEDIDMINLNDIIYHELGELFIYSEVDSKYKTLVKKYEKLYSRAKVNGYGGWDIVLRDTITRAYTRRVFKSLYGEKEVQIRMKADIDEGFIYVKALYDKLEVYENNRAKYKTFHSFFPELMKSLDKYMSDKVTKGDVLKDFNNWKVSYEGKVTFPDGSIYDGDLINGVPDGFGKMIGKGYQGKEWTFEGDWKNGAAVKGKLEQVDGSMYEGELKNWKPHGYGKYSYTDGTVQEGYFEDGVYVGK